MKSSYLFFLMSVCGLISCADDTSVGSGLLGVNDIEVLFTDDFDINIRQIAPAPFVQGFSQFHSLGTLNDDSFGAFTSSFYIRPFLSNQTFSPDFTSGIYDSLILVLKFDASLTYGSPLSSFDIEVYSLTESIDDTDSVRTDQTFSIDPVVIGSAKGLIPSRVDSLLLLSRQGDSTYFQDVISITLDRSFGEMIFLDTLNNKTDEGIRSIIDGFFIKANSDNSLLQIDVRHEVSSMIFVYKDTSGTTFNYPYVFDDRTSPLNFSYDLSGSDLEASINGSITDDLYYIQGHAGSIVEIDIENILDLNDPFVNHASLEVTAQIDGAIDTSLFSYPASLDLSTKGEDGSLTTLDANLRIFAGGLVINNEEGIVKYEMNITSYVKEVLEERQPSKIYLSVRNRVQTPNGLIIYGPNHPVYPARLKLTYTKS